MSIRWFYYAAPQTFYGLAGKLWPWFAGLAAVLALWGLSIGLLLAPADADRKSTRLNSSHMSESRMPSSA